MSLFSLTFGMHRQYQECGGAIRVVLGENKGKFHRFLELDVSLENIKFSDSQIWLWIGVTQGTFKTYRFPGLS